MHPSMSHHYARRRSASLVAATNFLWSSSSSFVRGPPVNNGVSQWQRVMVPNGMAEPFQLSLFYARQNSFVIASSPYKSTPM